MLPWTNQRGTTSLAEYAMTVFLVVATMTAMTIYVQRTLQARMRDARHYMAKATSATCDIYCADAAGLTTMLVNVKSESFNNAQCSDMRNLDCVQDSGFISVNRVGDQYEPYYAQVVSVVNKEAEQNKRLMASNEDAGIFMDQREAQSRAVSLSNQASPVYAGTGSDRVLISDRD